MKVKVFDNESSGSRLIEIRLKPEEVLPNFEEVDALVKKYFRKVGRENIHIGIRVSKPEPLDYNDFLYHGFGKPVLVIVGPIH